MHRYYGAQNDGFIMFVLKLMCQHFVFYKLELKVTALQNTESIFRTELVFQSWTLYHRNDMVIKHAGHVR